MRICHADVACRAKKRDEAVRVRLVVAEIAIVLASKSAVGEAHDVLLHAIPLELDHVVNDGGHLVDERLPFLYEPALPVYRRKRGVRRDHVGEVGGETVSLGLQLVALLGLAHDHSVVVGRNG